jgi:hypothetical protein
MMTKQGREPWGAIYRTKTWTDPLKWQAKAEEVGVCDRVFSCSMSDFFHAKADAWRDAAWEIIKQTPNLVYFLLTKRPARIMRHLPDDSIRLDPATTTAWPRKREVAFPERLAARADHSGLESSSPNHSPINPSTGSAVTA